MSSENNQEATVQPTNTVENVETNTEENIVKLSKTEYEKLNQDLGSLKRELKEFKKPKETSHQPVDTNELSSLQERLDKQTVRAAGITHEDDIKLAQVTAKKWNMSIDDLVYDDDFIAKLEKQRTNRNNLAATSDIKGNKGGGGGGNAKHSADYWLSKGVPPTPSDVPDKKTRVGIIRDMMKASKQGKKFYND